MAEPEGGLRPEVAENFRPFMEEVLAGYDGNVHSVHVVGSALTVDFRPGASDINSIFVLKEMELRFLEVLAPMGRKYRKKRVAAPLIMTPEYIRSSLDVFPVEFLSFRLIHRTVHGEDILKGLAIERADLRAQCERELKSKLVGLRQGYIGSMGEPGALTEGLVNSVSGYMPLFRGIISLLGGEPPAGYLEVLSSLSEASGVDCGVFEMMLREKAQRTKLSKERADSVFEDCYRATEKLARVVDEIGA
ncbi:MAG: hypothetical protein Kow0025_08580 [Thermodesulfovibrionales bacterium]